MCANRYDVLIAGAGPAGCATALALVGKGVNVLLLDRPLTHPFRIGESATPDVAGLLARVGVEPSLEHHSPYHGNLSLWGGDTPKLDHFLFRGFGHGWHLDRAAFDRMLQERVTACGITMLDRSSLDAIVPADGGWRVRVRGGGEVTAQVVVDAGGRRSPLAGRLGVRRRRLDRLIALATHAGASQSLRGYSLVESRPDGWWYAASLPDGRTLVTLMTDQDIARTGNLQDPETYLRAWRDTTLLAKFVPPPTGQPVVQSFAAHCGCIARAAGTGWICVGDALMALDPLASSGISRALSTALTAVPAIVGMLEGNRDAAKEYALAANRDFVRFLIERHRHYSAEQRWPDQSFWLCRRQAHAVPPTVMPGGYPPLLLGAVAPRERHWQPQCPHDLSPSQ